MTLGSDVSGLSTTAANAAGHGLSIVVPVYNEAAGLAMLHERLIGLARTLRQRHGLPCEVVYVDDGSKDNTLAIARTLAADFASGASRRDYERALPHTELDRLSASGLLAITVPAEYGGIDVSNDVGSAVARSFIGILTREIGAREPGSGKFKRARQGGLP